MMKTIRAKKPAQQIREKSTQKKYPLRGKSMIYRQPFQGVDFDDPQNSLRVPRNGRGKIIITPDFDGSLSGLDL